jgi:hypothetical protein
MEGSMNLKVSTWLAVAVAGGALIAGCGGSSTQTTSAAQTSTAQSSVVGQEAVATCDHNVQAEKTLSAAAKAKLEQICAKAANGSPATLQQVAHEACIELVNASHVPAGLPKAEALAICASVKAK